MIVLTSQTILGNAHAKRVGELCNSYISSGRNTNSSGRISISSVRTIYRPDDIKKFFTWHLRVAVPRHLYKIKKMRVQTGTTNSADRGSIKADSLSQKGEGCH